MFSLCFIEYNLYHNHFYNIADDPERRNFSSGEHSGRGEITVNQKVEIT